MGKSLNDALRSRAFASRDEEGAWNEPKLTVMIIGLVVFTSLASISSLRDKMFIGHDLENKIYSISVSVF